MLSINTKTNAIVNYETLSIFTEVGSKAILPPLYYLDLNVPANTLDERKK
jgi:hypothetical protein